MKIICVIPARAESSRFFEKPLAPISGKPMIRWVWEHCREVKEFDAVYVATDSEKIKEAAESFGAEVIMTASDHDTATERLYEVSRKVDADLYVMVNGDEPLLTREAIVQCIPPDLDPDSLFVSNLMTDFSNPVEVVDATNLKIVTAADNRCLFISRSPIPYPKGSLDVIYHKFVGVGAFTRKALDYYHSTPRGPIEKKTIPSGLSRTTCRSIITTPIANHCQSTLRKTLPQWRGILCPAPDRKPDELK